MKSSSILAITSSSADLISYFSSINQSFTVLSINLLSLVSTDTIFSLFSSIVVPTIDSIFPTSYLKQDLYSSLKLGWGSSRSRTTILLVGFCKDAAIVPVIVKQLFVSSMHFTPLSSVTNAQTLLHSLNLSLNPEEIGQLNEYLSPLSKNDLECIRVRSVAKASLQNRPVLSSDIISILSHSSFSKLPAYVVSGPRWSEIAGYDQVKTLLMETISSLSSKSDLPQCKGALLYGPPGNGKTLLASSLASSLSLKFVAVQVTELIKAYVGEGEKALAGLFKQARLAPTILFFDELESLFTVSGDRLCAALVSEIDSLTVDDKVVVLGATNFIDKIAPSLLRPDRLISVSFPNLIDRTAILQFLLSNLRAMVLEVDLESLAIDTEGWTGSALNELVRRVGLMALSRAGADQRRLNGRDFKLVMEEMKN